MSKVLLVSPPWRMPGQPSLALATLRPILEAAGMATDTLHATLLYPRTDIDGIFLSNYAAHLFVPHLYPTADVDAVIDDLVERFADELNLDGMLLPGRPGLAELGRDEAAMRRDVRAEVDRAGVCLQRCLERMAGGDYDVVGFSVTFETELPAALALARRLRARAPDVRIAFGGPVCFGEPAEALMAVFPEIDVACRGEGDTVVVPLIRALRGEGALAGVPGIAWRDGTGAVRRNPAPPLLADLDRLPEPDYQDFVSALEDSEWRAQRPTLFLETSRGCWWGQKHLCTFCGLNAEGLAFRRKSPGRALAEIRHLHARYPSARRLQLADNILDMGYIRDVLPGLRDLAHHPQRPLRLFAELKSNLRKDQIETLAQGGIDLAQPGIESFSDGVLALMKKGTTALAQIQFIKWATEAGIRLIYNLIVRNPGEQASWYREMLALVPAIEHLPPPDCVTPMWLERFSPYFLDPAAHGITRIAPRRHYRSFFPQPEAHLSLLAYVFDFDHPMHRDPELIAAQRALVHRVGRWQASWTPDRAYCYETEDGALVVVDGRDGSPTTDRLTGPAAQVLRALDGIRARASLQRQFPAGEVERVLDELVARRWVVRDGRDRLLCVLPARRGPTSSGRA